MRPPVQVSITPRRSRGRAFFFWWLLVATTLCVASGDLPAVAAPSPHRGGRILLSLPNGASPPLVLARSEGGWVGGLVVTNVGEEPLIVSRIAIRGDDDDVRSPQHLSVRFVDGPATSATIAPGAAKDAVVSWMPDREPRAHQAFGHVIATSTDERSGEVAMGFRAQLPTGLGWIGEHALSVLVLMPLVVAFVAAVSRFAGPRHPLLVRRVSIAVAVAELLLALWAYQRFSPDMGRADGNDGFQFVERNVWVRSMGAEWYVGVDGASVAFVLLAAALGLVAALVTRPADRRSDAQYAALALLASGVTGAFVALDLVLLFAAWQVIVVALGLLVGGSGGPGAERAAAKLTAHGAIGSAAMLAAFVALSRASGRTFLVDGAAIAHTVAIPELARTSFATKGAISGLPFVDVVWVLLFIAAAVATPAVPVHGWFVDVLEEAPAGASILVAGVVVVLGPYFLLRLGLAAIPEGGRWAAASVAAIGVLGSLYGSLCAMAQRNLRRFVAYSSIASAGTCLFGIGALTPQGIAGAVAGLFAHGVAAAMLLGGAGALEQRVRTCELGRLGGLARETPALAAIMGIGLATSLGLPVFVGFWGPLLSLLGGFARHPVLTILIAAGLVVATAAHVRVARLLLFGRVDDAWRRSDYLEPFGGRFPDATSTELVTLAPFAAVSLLLGIWPAPLLSQVATSVRDVSAAVDPAVPESVLAR